MLDERWEYKQYTTEGTLLNDNNYEKVFSHALTIIARHELEERNYWEISREEKKKAREEVYKILQTWCFEEKAENMTTLFGHIKDTKKQEQFKKFIKKYNKERALLSTDIYNPFYNLNKASFLRIIADAVSLGPLQIKRLSCNKELFNDLALGCIKYTDEKGTRPCLGINQFDNNSKTFNVRENTIDRTEKLFQIIAAYMVACEPTASYGNPVYLNKIETDSLHLGNKSYRYSYTLDFHKLINSEIQIIEENRAVFNFIPDYKNPNRNISRKINERIAKKGTRTKQWLIKKEFTDDYDIKLEPADKEEETDKCYIYQTDGILQTPLLRMFEENEFQKMLITNNFHYIFEAISKLDKLIEERFPDTTHKQIEGDNDLRNVVIALSQGEGNDKIELQYHPFKDFKDKNKLENKIEKILKDWEKKICKSGKNKK